MHTPRGKSVASAPTTGSTHRCCNLSANFGRYVAILKNIVRNPNYSSLWYDSSWIIEFSNVSEGEQERSATTDFRRIRSTTSATTGSGNISDVPSTNSVDSLPVATPRASTATLIKEQQIQAKRDQEILDELSNCLSAAKGDTRTSKRFAAAQLQKMAQSGTCRKSASVVFLPVLFAFFLLSSFD